jgi:glycerophosphoryl diester phosphodiesterase
MGVVDEKTRGIPELKGKKKPYVIAHRGNQTACPENTLAAFKRAIEDGADIIETDVHLTRDDVFVCIHDPSVDRTTNGKGLVADMTLAEIRLLSAGHGRMGFEEERIPTLSETVGLIPEDMALALELKTGRFLDEVVCERLIGTLKAEKVLERTVVLSFSMDHLKTMQRVCPAVYTGWITLTGERPLKGPHMLGPYWPILMKNPLYVLLAHMNRQAVCPLDTAPDRRLWFYRLLGCDAVITDNPAATCKKLGKKSTDGKHF